ncbi:hypothetical protein SASPL_123287 [Salvia splendens]|uniref:Myb/SANT-like domain-containing protein n=1 Tax=Salvia splendens TaxID=180675 RepID=A0A8X8XLE7_SALSN|nr:hypothetical protein SASPL_123287 [Salvia splendens]
MELPAYVPGQASSSSSDDDVAPADEGMCNNTLFLFECCSICQQAPSGSKGCYSITTRRAWSDGEELFLLGIMKELVATGWKSDNGFRSGIHTWKKSFYALLKILDRSGVEFNVHCDYKIDVSEDQWSEIVKTHCAWVALVLVGLTSSRFWAWAAGFGPCELVRIHPRQYDPLSPLASSYQLPHRRKPPCPQGEDQESESSKEMLIPTSVQRRRQMTTSPTIALAELRPQAPYARPTPLLGNHMGCCGERQPEGPLWPK